MSEALHDDTQRQLVQFVERYSQGPACLLVGCDETTRPLQVRTQNKAFNNEHLQPLQQLAIQGKLLSSQTGRTCDTDWTFTQLDEGVVVCIGAERFPQQKATPDSASFQSLGSAGQEDQKRESSEAWFEYWSSLEVPGISREDLDAHLKILRNIDFAATPLGSIDTWAPELLSAFTHCLATPHPVCMAWGEKDRTLLYNQPYSVIIGSYKHPRILGLPYLVAFEEAVNVARAVSDEAFSGRSVVVKDGITYLERSGYMEETYFSWSMVPIVHAPTKAVLGFHVAVFEAPSVITDRRMRFLRKADQAIDLTTTPASIFERTCDEAVENLDLPLLVFYECFDDNQDSQASAQASTEEQASSDPSSAPTGKHAAPFVQSKVTLGDMPPGSTRYRRSATNRDSVSNRLFPPHMNVSKHQQAQISSTSSLAEHFLQVQQTHKSVLVEGEALSPYLPLLEKTPLGDALTCIVLLPIVTGDNILRAVVVAGLNPRKQYDEDYQLFLQLLQGQITHGVASVRLIREKLDRTTLLAALTERKNEELRVTLEARTRQLQQSEQQFRNVLELSPVAICTLNAEGRFTWANPSWWRITGHPTDEPPDNWPRHINDDDLHIPQKLLAQALDTSQTIEAAEFRWKRKPGDQFDHWTWADLSRIFDEKGGIKEVIAVLIDHTDKKNLEKILETRADEANERRRAQEGFIDMVCHEVRNPLAAISLASEASMHRLERMQLLKDPVTAHQEDIPETLVNLKIINHCCMHMTRLIDDILTLSRLDNHFLLATPVPCCPVDFVTETFSIFKAEMTAKDIESSLDIRPSLMACKANFVLADPSRINQLVINLTTNAIKFTAPSQVRKITVTLDCSVTRPTLSGAHVDDESTRDSTGPETTRSDLFLLISIADTGCGMSQEEISGLFQRFKQANPKTHISYGGSGLGLFVCRRIVALLGGEIGVTSQVGKGSVFSFYVPVNRVSEETSASMKAAQVADIAASRREDAQSMQNRGTKESETERIISVLIVEDNIVNQKLLNQHLRRMGCVTICANNGQEALDIIIHSKWGNADGDRLDIVLMDIEMPVMSGLEAIQEIRRLQTTGSLHANIPVLAVTANARPEQITSMLASGFDGTVSKPFKIPAIMDKMRKQLLRGTGV